MEENTFDSWEFENLLTNEFFDGNTRTEIESLICKRLKSDENFRNNYELWLEIEGLADWEEYYQNLLDEADEVRISMSSGEDDDD